MWQGLSKYSAPSAVAKAAVSFLHKKANKQKEYFHCPSFKSQQTALWLLKTLMSLLIFFTGKITIRGTKTVQKHIFHITKLVRQYKT